MNSSDMKKVTENSGGQDFPWKAFFCVEEETA